MYKTLSSCKQKQVTDKSRLPHYRETEDYTDKPGYSLNPQIQPEGKPSSKPKGKADKTAEEQHAQDRAYAKEQEKEEPLNHRGHGAKNQQGERSAPGQAVDHPYQQRSSDVPMVMV